MLATPINNLTSEQATQMVRDLPYISYKNS